MHPLKWVNRRVSLKMVASVAIPLISVAVAFAPIRIAIAVTFAVITVGLTALGLSVTNLRRSVAAMPEQTPEPPMPQPEPKVIDPERMITLANSTDDERSRLGIINQLYLRQGFAPLELIDPRGTLTLGNIGTAIDAETTASPMVSIVMPAYNAEDTIGVAIRAVLSQTWRNIELVVVDDGSSDATAKIVREFADEDLRVRLVQQSNSGAFAARNTGLASASGDLVTVHDADDWSHAQMFEALIQPLLAGDDLVGTLAHYARCDHQIRFMRVAGARQHLKPAFVTLLIRRDVFHQIGTWDAGVVGGADTEFVERLRAYCGKHAVRHVAQSVPLLLALQRDGSLTNSTSAPLSSVNSALGVRSQYRDAYRRWHRGESFRSDLPWNPDNDQARPFPVPPVMRR